MRGFLKVFDRGEGGGDSLVQPAAFLVAGGLTPFPRRLLRKALIGLFGCWGVTRNIFNDLVSPKTPLGRMGGPRPDHIGIKNGIEKPPEFRIRGSDTQNPNKETQTKSKNPEVG